MARIRVYIKPFTSDGTAYDDWIEVTADVVGGSVGAIQRSLDVSDFDIGVYTNSAVALTLRNDQGRYSDIENTSSIFRFKRGDSLVKVTWDLADWDYFAGLSRSDEIQGGEVTVFEGLLNDDGAEMQLVDRDVSFNILGYESVFERSLAPDWTTSPPADNLALTLITEVLSVVNASLTTPIITVDALRIATANAVAWDDLTVFENRTCAEVLRDLLLASNSVLYMDGAIPVVSGRDPSASVDHTFYGPGSSAGPESICSIDAIRNGLNRTFNFVRWTDEALLSKDDTSIARVGVRKKDVSIDGITSTPSKQGVLDAIRTEFSEPRQEFKLVTPINYEVLALQLLARISIDYPVIPVSTDSLALYEIAEYGVANYPLDISSFEILTTDHYKVLGIDIDLNGNNATLYLRRIA